MTSEIFDDLLRGGVISDLDYHFARFVAARDPEGGILPGLAAALVSRSRAEGHVCIDLRQWAEGGVRHLPALPLPSADAWRRALAASPVVGAPGEKRPLCLDGWRLYLRRYWDYERKVAEGLLAMALDGTGRLGSEGLKGLIGTVFPDGERRIAAFAAARRRLVVVTGGPGTGKTTTAAGILEVLIGLAPPGQRVALAAPTGKASVRLQEVVKGFRPSTVPVEVFERAMPEGAVTIHRLLGAGRGGCSFRFHRANPLPHTIVVVDEASMVDLALFSRLLDALGPGARLILLGDKDQLASVEAGSVLGDICNIGARRSYSAAFRRECLLGTGREPGGDTKEDEGVWDCIVELTKSRRFREGGGIGELGRLINLGKAREALDLAKGDPTGAVSWRELPPEGDLAAALREWLLARHGGIPASTDPEALGAFLNRHRVLAVTREGPYGVYRLNVVIETLLFRHGLVRGRRGEWYPGRIVLITQNDYTLGLFNGDVGIALEGPDGSGPGVYFPSPDGTLRRIPPLRLPAHETAFATTVHKSQGSECDEVLFIMPDRDVPILTRELVYTAVTRAREKCHIWGREEVFQRALGRRIERSSGLREALWGRTDSSL